MDYYVHNLSPMAIEIGWFILPWYWLSYILGFFAVYFGMMLFSKNKKVHISKTLIHHYLSLGFLWLILGGRLGYIFIYNFSYYLKEPSKVFALWEGGMSFHGALIAVGLFSIYFARKYRIAFLSLTDGVSIFAPIGLFLGRGANFINGELAGRVSDVSWAVIFPKFYDNSPRHPSQLYEAFLEGFILFLIQFFWSSRRLEREGFSTGVFVLCYGIFRFFVEFFRNPDPQIGLYFGLITMGQILCSLMIVLGLVLIVKSDRKSITPVEK
ncbi:prolipoprotein diacylglyceryl transferase [Halobacteriovorax marinus]|uniref:prolipoprotein diacylglyceryl transferase n=1 Tax=Halobacteriovorax marinus TaxID=97084 RepID=UPI000BC33698|nr:prolipoprotein diacylglyceryl transferase [Halobacteriovorax marinus]ATH08551.1 prolipoprotein diacylglyceryl transferase [Halobacteriovorax marinus]